jgi:EpsI family protein
MSARLRLAFAWLVLWIPIGLWAHSRYTRESIAGFPAADLPAKLASHHAVRDEPLDPKILEILEPLAYVQRIYQDESQPPLSIYLAAYSGDESSSAHDPAICYPAQGWDLLHLQSVDVPLGEGEKLTAKLLSAAYAGEQQLALYWFQPSGRWPQREPLEEWLRVLDRLRGLRGHVFVRIALEDSGEPDFAERSLPVLIDVASELAPWIRAALEQARVTRSPVQALSLERVRNSAARLER